MTDDILGDEWFDDQSAQPTSTPDIDITPTSTEGDNDIFKFEDVSTKEDDITIDLLTAKGIDANNITIFNEDGEEVTVDFNSLSKEEKLDILTQIDNTTPSETELEDSEIELINTLRESGKTFEQYLEDYKNEILQSTQHSSESYEIDQYSDQELYLLDLKDKFPEWDDETLLARLDLVSQNEGIFKQEVDKIREEYKAIENEYKQNQVIAVEQEREENYNQLVNTMVDVATNTEDLFDFVLDDDDKNEILSYVLELDETGTSEFYKSLNNPKKLFELAWFAKKGKEAFEFTHDFYKKEIDSSRKRQEPAKTKSNYTKKDNPIKNKSDLSISDLYNF